MSTGPAESPAHTTGKESTRNGLGGPLGIGSHAQTSPGGASAGIDTLIGVVLRFGPVTATLTWVPGRSPSGEYDITSGTLPARIRYVKFGPPWNSESRRVRKYRPVLGAAKTQ